MRVPLTLALVLMALLSLVNVSAYNRGVVKGPVALTVTTTGSATLAVSADPASNSAYQVSQTANGVMQIHFGKGYSGAIHSLQMNRSQSGYSLPGDDLKMMGVFIVTNNSTVDCVDVSVYVTDLAPGTQTNLSQIRGRPVGTAWGQTDVLLATGNGVQNSNRFKLGKAGSGKDQMYADFRWVALNPVGSTGNTFWVKVSGSKATCPP